MNTKPLKVKILGSGKAAEKHRQAFERLPHLYKVTTGENPDIIDVCTPPGMHYQQILDNLENAHVIVEKPICGSLEAMDGIMLMSGLTGNRVIPICQYRYSNPDDISDEMTTHWARHDHWYEGWRNQWDISLGGCLVSHGIHLIDLVIQNRGMPKWLFCHMDFDKNVETAASIRMGDVKINIRVGEVTQKGFNFGDTELGFVCQFQTLAGDLMYPDSKPGSPSLVEARQVIEVLTACYYSHIMQVPVSFPLKQNHPFYGGWTERLERQSPMFQSFQKISEVP